MYTPLRERQPDRPLENVAQAHGMAAAHADGNDVVLVRRLTRDARERAINGRGPTFLVFDTYRWREHCGPNFDNDLGYRTADEFRAWKRRCPIARMRRSLLADGSLTEAEDEAVSDEIRAEVNGAFEYARHAPFPDSASAASGVYA